MKRRVCVLAVVLPFAICSAQLSAQDKIATPQTSFPTRLLVPEDYVTNLAFGGFDRKTLYVSAGTSIYKVSVAVSGHAVYPPLRP